METASEQKSGYGLCLENPVRVTGIPLEYAYLSHIISPAGTPFVPSGKRYTCQGMVDCHCGHYLNAAGEQVETNIFIHAYNRENDIRPPEGWTMSEMSVPKSARKSYGEKKGCLVLFVIAMGSVFAICVTVCAVII